MRYFYALGWLGDTEASVLPVPVILCTSRFTCLRGPIGPFSTAQARITYMHKSTKLNEI